METTLFIQQLGNYFEIYLPKTDGYSQNTISSYKDTSSRLGKRDQTLLCLLYDSSARAQELCDVTVVDVRFGSLTRIKRYGKGRKTQEIPLTDECSKLIKQYIKSQNLINKDSYTHPLFSSQTHEKMTTTCIRNIV